LSSWYIADLPFWKHEVLEWFGCGTFVARIRLLHQGGQRVLKQRIEAFRNQATALIDC